MMSQQLALAKKPHVIVATPGRLVDHLEKTRGFNLKALKFLIMDEADRILNLDFEAEVDKEWIRKLTNFDLSFKCLFLMFFRPSKDSPGDSPRKANDAFLRYNDS